MNEITKNAVMIAIEKAADNLVDAMRALDCNDSLQLEFYSQLSQKYADVLDIGIHVGKSC